MSGSVRSWMHYIDLRTGHGTQEHMELAEDCKKIFVEQFPVISEHWSGSKYNIEIYYGDVSSKELNTGEMKDVVMSVRLGSVERQSEWERYYLR